DAERAYYREKRERFPDDILFPYPDPEVLGLKLDPKEMATVSAVAPGSIADRAGLKSGDSIVRLDGQPLLSIADIQWVLQNTSATAQLKAEVSRNGSTRTLTLDLPRGWRDGNISWRTTTWSLRRMALGGLALKELSEEERREAKIAPDDMALRAFHVG